VRMSGNLLQLLSWKGATVKARWCTRKKCATVRRGDASSTIACEEGFPLVTQLLQQEVHVHL